MTNVNNENSENITAVACSRFNPLQFLLNHHVPTTSQNSASRSPIQEWRLLKAPRVNQHPKSSPPAELLKPSEQLNQAKEPRLSTSSPSSRCGLSRTGWDRNTSYVLWKSWTQCKGGFRKYPLLWILFSNDLGNTRISSKHKDNSKKDYNNVSCRPGAF